MPDPRPYENFSLADLYQEQEEQKAVAVMAKDNLALIQWELQARYGSRAASDLMNDTGTRNYNTARGFNIKAEVKREVTWDSDALLKLALSMPLERARDIFDITVKIKERVYAKLTGATRAAAEAARTEERNPVKITLEKKG